MSNILYPMKLMPYTKSSLWGGNKLRKNFGKLHDGDNIAESWELTCRKNEQSVVANGPLSGMTLSEVIYKLTNKIVSDTYNGDRFPVLVKFIDSETSLSVQVHPDDEYALKNENEYGKTEMWHIVDCEPDSELIIGVKNYDTSAFKTAANEGKLQNYLCKVKVNAGDTFFIPAGLVHAIGAKITLIEIQQNSDVTYRVYDYNRVDSSGHKRELHIDRACEVIREYTDEEIENKAYEKGSFDQLCTGSINLANSSKFVCDKIFLENKITLVARDISFVALTVISGKGYITHAGQNYCFDKGDTYFIPAGLGEFTIDGDAQIICVQLTR